MAKAKAVVKDKEAKKSGLADYLVGVKGNHQKIISTGITPFDMVMEGGFYSGDIIEVFGDTGTGKSTSLIQIAKNLCDQGYKVMYLDFERGQKMHENSLIVKSGLMPYVENDQFILLNQLTTFTDLEAAIEFGIENKVSFIMVDSLTAVLPTSTLENPIEKATIGVEARLQTTFVKKYKSIAQLNNFSIIFISQLRTKIGMGFMEQTEIVSAGAKAVGFFGDMRLCLQKGPKLTRMEIKGTIGKELATCGNKAKLYAFKNRAGRPDITVPCPILFGKGVSMPYFYFEIMQAHKYITGGAWKEFTFPDGQVIRENGEMNFIRALGQNKDKIHQFLQERGHFILVRGLDEEIELYGSDEDDEEEETEIVTEVVPPVKAEKAKKVEKIEVENKTDGK